MEILTRLRAIQNLGGNTYSSAEVIGAIGQAANEIERLRVALTQFVAACDTAPPTGLMREIVMARKAAGEALGLKD